MEEGLTDEDGKPCTALYIVISTSEPSLYNTLVMCTCWRLLMLTFPWYVSFMVSICSWLL